MHGTGVLPDAFALEMPRKPAFPWMRPVPYRLEPAYLVLARLFLAQGNPDAALTLCERLLPEAKTGERGKTVTGTADSPGAGISREKGCRIRTGSTGKSHHTGLARAELCACFWMKASRWRNCSTRPRRMRIGGEFVEELLSCFGLPPVGLSHLLPSLDP